MFGPEFIRPMAHRGLHDAAAGVIENTRTAFEAAIAGGYGIECDLQPAAGGLPIVFHDDTIERLIEGASGPTTALSRNQLLGLRFRGAAEVGVPTFADVLQQVGGRVPMLVEIKSFWRPVDGDPDTRAFLAEIARLAAGYRGPIALMSFDPGVMAAMRRHAPGVPRGLVSGSYFDGDGTPWWPELGRARAFRLANLLDLRGSAPDFFAYDVTALPTLATRVARSLLGKPLLTWTVRTAADRDTAAHYADAPIFEGWRP